MGDTVEFELDDGTTVAVAASSSERSGSGVVGDFGEHLEAAEKTLRQALRPITTAASEVIDSFRRLPERPDEVEVSFGVQLDGKAGGVIASVKGGAHLDVKLRWRSAEPASSTNTTTEPSTPESSAG